MILVCLVVGCRLLLMWVCVIWGFSVLIVGLVFVSFF